MLFCFVMAAQADLAEGKIARCGGHPFLNESINSNSTFENAERWMAGTTARP